MLALVDFILFYSEIKASLLALVDLKTSTLYCKYYTHAQILILQLIVDQAVLCGPEEVFSELAHAQNLNPTADC